MFYPRVNMKIMYRGVRLKEHQIDETLKNGMKYYWSDPEESIRDVFKAIKTHNILRKLVNNGMLECRITEGSEKSRNQIFCTEDKRIAESYARDTPELIFLTLQNGLISIEKTHNYLNKTYGLPHIVEFKINSPKTPVPEINKRIGEFVPPENIIDIKQVDLTKPDPIHMMFSKV